MDKEIKARFETDNPTDEQSIKHMDQNLLKTQNLCILMRIL